MKATRRRFFGLAAGAAAGAAVAKEVAAEPPADVVPEAAPQEEPRMMRTSYGFDPVWYQSSHYWTRYWLRTSNKTNHE